MDFTRDKLQRLQTAVALAVQLSDDAEDAPLLTKIELMLLTSQHTWFDSEGKTFWGQLQRWGQNSDGTFYAVMLHEGRLHTVEAKTVTGISAC